MEWVEIPPDDPMLRPIYGPPCPGPLTHTWRLTVEEGQIALNSGCEECNDTVFGPVGGEDVFMQGEIVGTLASHLETYGWETPEYDHWWEFVPVSLAPVRLPATTLEVPGGFYEDGRQGCGGGVPKGIPGTTTTPPPSDASL